jgi:hypothetical protein
MNVEMPCVALRAKTAGLCRGIGRRSDFAVCLLSRQVAIELAVNRPGIEQYLRIEGGQRVTDIKITDIDPVVNPYPDQDDYLTVKLDHYGDFSTYAVRLVGVDNIDPRYERAEFTFKIDCGTGLDCAPDCGCQSEIFPSPRLII